MRTASLFSSFLLAGAALALGGCNLEQRYLSPPGAPPGSPYTAAITETTPVFLEAEEEALVMVETRVDFPVHGPETREEWNAHVARPAVMPFPRLPWVTRDAYQVEIDFVLSNLEDRNVVATITVNGINEFNEYVPSAQIVDDDLVVDFANWERTYLLRPGERRIVTVREEELDEVAVDLASVVNGMDCMMRANQITYFMNQAGIDTRSTACIPELVPGLVGVKIGLRTQVELGAVPPRLVVEASVRMRDVMNRVAAADETPWDLNGETPVPFTPPVMMMP